MSIVTISLNNRSFRLACPEENQPRLIKLAEAVDLEMDKIKRVNPSASFELLLVMVALRLQDEKDNKVNENGGLILENAQNNFHEILSAVEEELREVIKKI